MRRMMAANVAALMPFALCGCAANDLPVIDPHTDFEVVRVIDVEPERVWSAWTDAELVRRWWGPGPFTCPRAEMDVRVGGRSLVGMQAPREFGGGRTFVTWTYSRVVPFERLEFDSRFSDADGRAMSAEQFGLPEGFPDVIRQVVRVRRLADGSTELRVAEFGYGSPTAIAQSRQGLELCLEKMQGVLEAR